MRRWGLIPDRDFVLEGLLKHNYLPAQKKDKEELPPVFSSVTFSPNAARELVKVKQRDGSQGWDSVEYRTTRFNGVPRALSIPHPLPYAYLCLCIHENWGKLEHISHNKTSLVRPSRHPDGRVIIMDYEKSRERSRRTELAFGKRFVAHTDIGNCFPSIYSHAVPWAAVGFQHAKTHKGHKYAGEWFNQLDEKLRWTKRNETQGVAIGPATSNIVAEVILANIDDTLNHGGFVFVRFIDDYTAYCETEEGGQEFIRRLAQELSAYKLLLNIRKTEVFAMPGPSSPDWVSRLALSVPKGKVGGHDALNYLDFAVSLAKQEPDGSVLKYAVKTLVKRGLDPVTASDLLPQVLALCFHQPVLIPLLDGLYRSALRSGPFRFGPELHRLALENARWRRSDGLCWTLFYLNKYGVAISADLANEVVKSKDCLGLLLLYLSGIRAHQDLVVEFAGQLDATELYELDQYWLLLYKLFLDSRIANPYAGEDVFPVLQHEGVTFVA